MSQFIYLYRTSDAARQESMGTPERAQQNMQRWMSWLKELDAKGHLKRSEEHTSELQSHA